MANLKTWLRQKLWDEWLHDPAQVGASGGCIFYLIIPLIAIIAALLFPLFVKLRDFFSH
jgi:hypothetical protein